ncbi:acyltransferase [Rhodococcus sp. 15-1154-1]|nr:acyltransferase family protein [Rhodococcus sp. 15-1154-1]OZF07500.1 acyltransferase [Rhodococcus sp. 15-1154-1]
MSIAHGSQTRRRSKRRSTASPKRHDIQTLRAIAVLLVIADHLFGWPSGGFIGVDVFFVISGFLITGLLLREFDRTGSISFAGFYRRRIRRIVPIATVVIVFCCVAGALIFSQARAKSIGIDGIWAFFFASNWRFAIEGTDYFNADTSISPLQHYWSLSIEEQFYFVWPALMLLIGVLVARRSLSAAAKRTITAAVMGTIVAVSFGWAVYETATNQTWAYFSTFTRVWELGVGALLAIGAGVLARIPRSASPYLAWSGLAVIAVGVFVISESGAFPAPLAAIPVLGAALVIASGIGGAVPHSSPLNTRAGVYIGDLSYSLYLWHWPLIIFLGALMDPSFYYYVTVLALTFGLSVASYHFVENPIRHSTLLEPRAVRAAARRTKKNRLGRQPMPVSSRYAAVGAVVLMTAAFGAFALQPVEPPTAPPARAVVPEQTVDAVVAVPLGPANAALASEIDAAVNASEWPDLVPSMDDAIDGAQAPTDIVECGLAATPDPSTCMWGSPDAPRSIMVLGDSMAMSYVQSIRNFAEASNGEWKVRSEAMFGCAFVDMAVTTVDGATVEACPGRKDAAVRAVIETRPDVVIVTNLHTDVSPELWVPGMQRLTDRFESSVGKIVFLSAPPNDKKASDCYTRTSAPADCISRVTDTWRARNRAEINLAARVGGVHVDSRALFCTPDDFCPSFVGTTPMKSDSAHMSVEYGQKISPAFGELLRSSGAV